MTLPIRHRHGSLLERGIPWHEPTAEFEDLFERMNRFLESTSLAPSLSETMTWAPLADMHETDDTYKIECELPGMKREDIDVEITEHELRISGELKERTREGVLRRRGRPTGRFEYRALLPTDVKAEDVQASLSDGVLTVTIPKAQAAKPRHIEIKG
ncbi:Hsp20/alpha crystallin family protein [Streptomyces inhibens]|uniref:Hsp20/alpha crystallin family protein n=1 Tax=Streptomyces inhibens TaxID=2293571 RepID=A0A371PVR2_STRIH|nr:Hsp20/alpha crystallin family protein [Streptomyces inhibens]REK86233.1 Hsp20/alpha crystallin family protein [Streptomyces inhibens]